jgi:hypothetical protein
MSIPKFESNSTRASNPRGEVYKDENLDNEDDNRGNLEQAQKGRNAYVQIENVSDEDAEQAIYDNVEASIIQEREGRESQLEPDQFGYIAMMDKIVGRLDKKEKEKFLDNGLMFLPLHHKIVNDDYLSDQEKDKLLREQFTKIFGHQISTYDAENTTTSMSMYKKQFIKVSDKEAPADAYHPGYINKGGRPFAVDSVSKEKTVKSEKKTKKEDRNKSLFKLPFRKANR